MTARVVADDLSKVTTQQIRQQPRTVMKNAREKLSEALQRGNSQDIIAALVQFVEIFLKKYVPSLYSALGIYLPLITTNCAVLGVTVLNIDEGYNFIESIVNTIGAGFGFMLAMAIFAGVRGRMETSDVPKFLQGLPIVLVAASIVACSFLGFQGLVDGLFN